LDPEEVLELIDRANACIDDSINRTLDAGG
jgi:hypothetical protein